jgi:curved DNA-binding protein CbpA
MEGRLEDDFRKIDDFLVFTKRIDTFANFDTIYELFGIGRNDSYPKIETKINGFVNRYSGSGAGKFKDLGRIVSNRAETIKRVLREHKSEYNEYLEENHPKIKKLLEYFQTSTKYDNILNSNEKDILIKEAEAAGLPESEIYSLIDKWKKKYDVKEAEYSSSASTSSAVPFDVLLNKTYYEFLGLPEDAEYSQIKEVYDREYQNYNTVRDKKRAEARWVVVSEAWECLRDPVKRREYDEKLRRERESGFTREGDPRLEILDENGKEKRSFEFKNIRLGSTSSVTLTVKNGGGGTLDAKVKTNCSWLLVNTNRIHQSKLPKRITITVDPRKDKSKNSFASADKGAIEISYQRGSYIESERISVAFSIEVPDAALKRFIIVMLPPIAIIGGLIGLLVSLPLPTNSVVVDVFNLLNLLIMILAAIAIPIFFGIMAKEGYQFVIGCGTYIGICVILGGLFSFFEFKTTPTLPLFIFNGGLFFSLIFLLVSEKLFPYRKSIITKSWLTAGAMLLVAILIGILAEQWQAYSTRLKANKMTKLVGARNVKKAIRVTDSKLTGEWHGKAGKSHVKLFINRKNNILSGKMVRYFAKLCWVEEKLSVKFENKDDQTVIILKAISVKFLKGGRTLNYKYNLDTFYGTLSRDGRTIGGSYVDTERKKGEWSVSKVASGT